MHQVESLQDDLRYVKQAVERSQCTGMPLGIALIWAVAVLAGFALVDWRPDLVGWYWLIAGSIGCVASYILGVRYGRRAGVANRATGLRITAHWLGMAGAIALSLLLVWSGELSAPAIGRLILLLLALAYFYAGLHFSRGLLWISLLLAIGFAALGFFVSYTWTCLGVLTCVALLATGLAEHTHD